MVRSLRHGYLPVPECLPQLRIGESLRPYGRTQTGVRTNRTYDGPWIPRNRGRLFRIDRKIILPNSNRQRTHRSRRDRYPKQNDIYRGSQGCTSFYSAARATAHDALHADATNASFQPFLRRGEATARSGIVSLRSRRRRSHENSGRNRRRGSRLAFGYPLGESFPGGSIHRPSVFPDLASHVGRISEKGFVRSAVLVLRSMRSAAKPGRRLAAPSQWAAERVHFRRQDKRSAWTEPTTSRKPRSRRSSSASRIDARIHRHGNS